MGCICSFFKTLTSYHGSHLTAHQVNRQRQQRARKPRQPSRDSPPLITPTDRDKEATPQVTFPSALARTGLKGPMEEEKLLSFTGPPRQKLGDCGKQSSFSQSKFSASFSKS